MKVIVLSGTPGSGKSSVAQKLSKLINAEVIPLAPFAISQDFSVEYDEERQTNVVDINRFLPTLVNKVKAYKRNNLNFLIIEGHFSDILPNKYIDYAFVLRCDPDHLILRLEKRGYELKKIRENIQAEILGNCMNYFIQKKIDNRLFEIDTTKLSIEMITRIILDIVAEKIDGMNYKPGKVDWLEKLFQENRLHQYFD